MAYLLTSDEDRAAAQNAGYGIADCGLAAGMWGNKFVANLASDVETLRSRVEALSAFVKRVKAHFDRHGINNDADLRLQEAARKVLEENR